MEKHQSLLHYIGGVWYLNKLNQNLPPIKKRKLSKKSQENEDETEKKLQTANKYWNNWIFQIHWNKLGWVNPINCNEQKSQFCVSYKESYMKDNNKTAHWVGHAKLKPLDTDDFSKEKSS